MEASEAKLIIQKMYKGQPTTMQIEALDMAYGALEKSIAKRPKEMKWVKFAGSIRPNFKSGKCPCCKEYVDTDDDMNVCGWCGQRLGW